MLLLPVHIVAAGLGIVAGAVALSAAKGAWLHRKSGMLFVFAITVMCASATILAAMAGQTVNVIAGLLTAYLAITAMTTVRPPSARSRSLNAGLMVLALVLGLATFTFGIEAFVSATGRKFGYPPLPFYLFGAIGLSGALGDVRIIRSGALRGAPRIRRHLWRMCVAMFIATASFFSIRARVVKLLPAAIVTPALQALPVILVILAMVYWLWRIRAKRADRGFAGALASALARQA
jgi:hypothetical protein